MVVEMRFQSKPTKIQVLCDYYLKLPQLRKERTKPKRHSFLPESLREMCTPQPVEFEQLERRSLSKSVLNLHFVLNKKTCRISS